MGGNRRRGMGFLTAEPKRVGIHNMQARLKAEEYLDTAMQALATGDVCQSLLDRLPVPIYTTTGEFLPHDQCPMAQAIREQRAIRGAVAIAMRPDGSRRAFTPYPTPLFDDEGRLTGAVNMLVDVSAEQADVLADQARRCRRLADATYDRQTCSVLSAMADEFARTAEELCH